MVARKAALISGSLVAALLIAAICAWLHTGADARVAIHFDAAGRPDGWASPARAFLSICLLPAGIWCLMAVLPRIDPRGRNLARSEYAYGVAWVAVTLSTCLSGANLIARTFGIQLPINQFHVALLGGLLIVVGNVMGKIRWNYTFGIRTPWTLADERVWDKTHRFGGWALVAGGAFFLVGGLMFPDLPLHLMVIPTLLLITVAVVLRSYLLWRSSPHS